MIFPLTHRRLAGCVVASTIVLAVTGWPVQSWGQGMVPNFSLTDVNPNSPKHNTRVSPRDYLQQGSAWYFGHAT